MVGIYLPWLPAVVLVMVTDLSRATAGVSVDLFSCQSHTQFLGNIFLFWNAIFPTLITLKTLKQTNKNKQNVLFSQVSVKVVFSRQYHTWLFGGFLETFSPGSSVILPASLPHRPFSSRPKPPALPGFFQVC